MAASSFRRRRLIAAVSCLVLAISSVSGQASDLPNADTRVPVWAKTATDCDVQVVLPKHVDYLKFYGDRAITWSGVCLDGRASGFGTLIFPSAQGVYRYEGGMLAGVMSGRGTLSLPDGSTVSGDWQNGVDWRGTLTLPDGGTVSGHYQNGSFDDQVVIFSSKGMHYKGQGQQGIPSGVGTASWPSGVRYEGHWLNGKESGSGVMNYVSVGRPKYEGEFRDGKRNGHGVLSFEDGGRFEGEWTDDSLNGHGSMDSPKGFHFVGEFSDGKMHGTGTMISSDGSRYEGEWRNGVPDGKGTLTRAGLSPFSGTWKHGCFHEGDRHATFVVDPSSCF
jgi:hypothetical protein